MKQTLRILAGGIVVGLAAPACAGKLGNLVQAMGQASAEAQSDEAIARHAEMVQLIGPNYEDAPEVAVSPGSREAAGNISPKAIRWTQHNGVLAELAGTDRDPGIPQSAAVGSVAYAQFLYFVRPELKLVADVDWSPAPEQVYKIRVADPIVFGPSADLQCTRDELGYLKGKAKKHVCFYDTDGDGRVDQLSGIAKFAAKQTPPQPIAYRYVATSVVASKFRKELSYLGRTGDTLRFQYREFQTNLIRPAFTTELTYAVAAATPTVVRFQDIVLRVDRIDNEGIGYVVEPAK